MRTDYFSVRVAFNKSLRASCLIKIIIFHLKRLMKMPLILFMMIGMPVTYQWNRSTTQGRGGCRKRQVRSQKPLPLRNEKYEKLVRHVSRRKCLYFDLDSAKEALKKGEMTIIYEVPADYLQKAKEKKGKCNDSHLGYWRSTEIST